MKAVVNSKLPMISVVIPMKNEEHHVSRCLESVVTQDYPSELVEVLVVDGGSYDGSVEIVKQFMEKHSNIRLVGGPGVNCPAAMNIGIRNVTGDAIAKVDAHGYPDPNFLRMSVKHLFKKENIKCVGGPIRPVAETYIAKTNALARSSIFGVGRGIYSMGEKPQFVDTVQCGIYKKDIFGEIGLFDESLQFGEDEEINWRIRKNGYKIFSTPEIRFFYFPRSSFRKLFKQYYNYGVARVKVVQKHPDFMNIKHIIPTAFVLALFATGILAIFSSLSLRLFLAIAVLYLIASLTFSILIGVKENWRYIGLLPISFAALHFGYAIGFARGIMGLWAQARHIV